MNCTLHVIQGWSAGGCDLQGREHAEDHRFQCMEMINVGRSA